MRSEFGEPSFAGMTRRPASTARRSPAPRGADQPTRIDQVGRRAHQRAVAWWITAILGIVTAGVLSLGGSPALASSVSCGATITADTTLHHDLVNCAGNGLVIGRDNITLNLNGHTVDGNDAEDVCPGEVIYCDDGINNAAGHTGITIKGGTIHRFDIGVVAVDADDNVLRELTTSNNAVGIQFNHSAAGRIADNSVTDNFFYGVQLINSSDRNRVETNVLSGNEFAIGLLRSDRNDLDNNVVSHNFESGIGVENGSVGNRLRANLLTENADGIIVGEARDTQISRNVIKRSGYFGSPETGGFGIAHQRLRRQHRRQEPSGRWTRPRDLRHLTGHDRDLRPQRHLTQRCEQHAQRRHPRRR